MVLYIYIYIIIYKVSHRKYIITHDLSCNIPYISKTNDRNSEHKICRLVLFTCTVRLSDDVGQTIRLSRSDGRRLARWRVEVNVSTKSCCEIAANSSQNSLPSGSSLLLVLIRTIAKRQIYGGKC